MNRQLMNRDQTQSSDVQIRLGVEGDLDSLEQLYDDLNDYLQQTTNYPGWKKGIYPIRQDAVKGIEAGTLFVMTEKDEIIGSMILSHEPEQAYFTAPWQALLDYNDVFIVYTFAVSPKKMKRGIGTQMLEFAGQYGKNTNKKALRLDVYENNVPAIELYEKCGFQYIETVSLGLEDYGLDCFKLYEKLL